MSEYTNKLSMNTLKRIHQINQWFPQSFSSYPKPVLFSAVVPSVYEFSTYSFEESKEAVLYIHIPFCTKKCSFCFIDVAESKDPDLLSAYVNILLEEIRISDFSLSGLPIRSVYIGGWTPTILRPADLEKIVLTIREYFSLSEDVIWEIDATPVTLTDTMLKCLEKLRISNINIGIQSTEKEVLQNIWREWQTKATLKRVWECIAKYNFSVHLDFIIGLPWEHISTFRDQIDALYDLFRPKSLSINLYEETVYSPDFYSDAKYLYPKYKYLTNIAGLLDKYISSRYWLNREQTPYIEIFHKKRQNVFAFWAWAFWYIRWYGMYKNAALSEYTAISHNMKSRYWIQMSRKDEQIMFLIHNIFSWNIFEIYKQQFDSTIEDDFPNIFEGENLKHISTVSDRGGRKFQFINLMEVQEFFVPFYSPEIIALYEKIISLKLEDIGWYFNTFYGK